MIKGAFGIEVSNGVTLFNGGQGWIKGTDPYFLEQLPGRDSLEAAFPALKVTGERMAQSWPNSQGVIYLRYLPKVDCWALVYAYQPEFSIQRSVPVWLCQRIPGERFLADMLLYPAIKFFIRAREELVTLEHGASPWLSCGDPAVDPPESVGDFRAAALLFERMQSQGAVFDSPIDAREFWRGLQVLLCGYAKARQAVWISVMLEPNVPVSAPTEGGALLSVVADRSAEVVRSRPVYVRGVSDDELVAYGKTPTDLLAESWTSIRVRPGRRCEELVEPPIELLPTAEVRAGEVEDWASAIWKHESRAHARLRDLVRDGRLNGWTPDFRRKALHILLSSPAARRQSRPEVVQFLRERLEPFVKAQ